MRLRLILYDVRFTIVVSRFTFCELMTPVIQVQNIIKTFGTRFKDVAALHGVSFDIEQSELISVIGASGAGKSTLLHILGALDRPSQGKVLYRGDDIFTWNDKKLADFRNRKIGFIFQAHHLLPEFTAVENTMMPALIRGMGKRKAKNQAEDLLVKMGLKDRLGHKPGELSGGEQQRVAIARALIMKPEIILADEPTGNLDSKTGAFIFDLLRQLNRDENIIMVIVTHNEHLAACTPRSIKLRDGVKIGDTEQ